MSLRPSVVLVIAALLGASLAGCSAAAGGENGEVEQSPLEKIFSEVYGMGGSEEEQQAAFEEQQTESEELVAECMAEEVRNARISSHGIRRVRAVVARCHWRAQRMRTTQQADAGLSTSKTLLDAAITHRNLRTALADAVLLRGARLCATAMTGVFLVLPLALRYNPRIPDWLTRNA